MSENPTTLRCSSCKTNRPSSLFIHPRRAAPYKTRSNCRSRQRSRNNPRPFQAQAVPEIPVINNQPNTGADIGFYDIEEPRVGGPVIGEESLIGDDPSVHTSPRDYVEYQPLYARLRRLLLEDDTPEDHAHENNEDNETFQPADAADEERAELDIGDETVPNVNAANEEHVASLIDPGLGQLGEQESIGLSHNAHRLLPYISNSGVVPRRLPPWLAARGLNRAIPAGYISQFRHDMPVHDLGYRTSICPFCRALHWPEERVQGSSLRSPRFQTCCREGQVVIAPIPDPPEFLRRLWTSEEAYARRFRRQARQYNRAFAFTSFNFTPDQRLQERGIHGGIQSFSIHGEIFHRTGAISRTGVTPAYSQLYFLDPEQAMQQRTVQSNLDPMIVRELTAMINESNPFAQYYRSALESLQAVHAANVANQTEQAQRVILNPNYRLILEQGADRRRYNLPTAQEVAVLIPDGSRSDTRDVVLFTRNNDGELSDRFEYIHRAHPAYLPLHYVLFYPFGNPGYRWEMRLSTPMQRVRGNQGEEVEGEEEGAPRGSISARLFYRYHLFSRQDSPTLPIRFNPLIHGERLFQQICCDMFACVDDTVLNWHRLNQETVRADLYSGVIDALRSDVVNESIGRPVILSASYHGGDRHMARCYQNAMAIVRHVGKPVVFLTVTANPSWPEIVRYLEHGQSPHSRPDLIAIVFHLKLKAFLHDTKKRQIYGRCTGSVYVIEYQKRGLPHAHALLFLHEDDVPRCAEQVDELVSAQMPTNCPALADIVKSQMVHGPCGPNFPNSPCYQNGRCSKGFPKQWCEATIMTEDSYPEYARPNNGVTWTNGGFTFDNRWVVPYNPYLTMKYNCHINVEIARGVHAIKYLAKYVYKGSDRASLAVQENYDEILMTIQGRYISPVQAIWRLMAYTTHEEKPAVMLLYFHLEGRHRVSFNVRQTPGELAAAIASQSSTFLDWMKYNAAHTDGRNVRYFDFPQFYTYTKRTGWRIRRKGCMIGRMPLAVPSQGEHFYLRMLLNVKRGARSYRDLYTVNGTYYEHPSATCRALGLTFDDSVWIALFGEVRDTSTARSLRQILATGLAHSVIIDPQSLWDRYRLSFTDDCLHRLQNVGLRLNPPPVEWNALQCRYDFGLWLLGDNLRDHNLDWRTARLAGPVHRWIISEENPLIEEALDIDRVMEATIHTECLGALSLGQRMAYNTIINAIDSGCRPNTFFIQGPAGTGKTFLYKTLCTYYRSQGKIVLCVASSGIAALLLPNGRTAHSMFRIPIECTEESMCSISGQSHLASLIKRTALVIWDEVTMQLKHNFGAVHKTLQDLMGNNNDMFGGIPVVLGGDFAQILPVVKRGGRVQIVNACVRFWSEWYRIQPLFLTDNMRIVEGELNQRFAMWLSQLPYTPSLYGAIDIPEWIRTTSNRGVFRDFVYPLDQLRAADNSIFWGRAILTSRNDNVDRFNREIAQLRTVESHEYYALDQVQSDESDHISDYTTEYLHSLSGAGLPLGILTLQIGMPVMLVRNYYSKLGLCNGTRLIVTRLFNHCIRGRVISPDPRYDGQEHIIAPMTITSSDDLPLTLTRKQLPLRPSYSMTINKSQGQTLQRVGVDLSVPVFTHGQFYVALSRVTDVNNLIVLLPGGTRSTSNVVYPEVLLRPTITRTEEEAEQ